MSKKTTPKGILGHLDAWKPSPIAKPNKISSFLNALRQSGKPNYTMPLHEESDGGGVYRTVDAKGKTVAIYGRSFRASLKKINADERRKKH